MIAKQSDPASFAHRAANAAWWSVLEIAARYGVQFVIMVVLARLLRPVDFGLLAMLLVFTTSAALLVEGGLGSALVQKQDTSADDETSVFFVNLAAGCALAALLWVLAPSIAQFYSQPVLVPLLHLLLWVLPLGALAAVPNALLSKRLDFRTRSTAELIASLGSGALALWLAWRGHGVWSLAWQIICGAALRAVLLWMLSGWRPRGRFERRAFAGLFRFGGFLLLANLLNVFSVRLQSLLIGRLFDARALGLYTMAQETQQAPAQFMSSLLNRVGLPIFSVVATQPVKLARALRLSLRLSMFVFLPSMAAIAAMANPLITVLYGPAWLPSAPMLSVLALAAAFWPLHILNLAAISAGGRSEIVLRLEIVKALVSIPLILVASHFGVLAIAWAVLLSSLLCVVINTWYSRTLLGCGTREQLIELAPIVLLSLASGGLAWLASNLVPSAPAKLTTGLLAMSVAYVGLAASLRMQAWQDLLEFLRTLLGDRNSGQEGKSP
ncbi:lipopolysaccharide biosynthesis protein [Luteimonas kalidii]|uniref:Lipopolysaccharide biosynthesis protein n=1 Tax=Luteimonas kalidii TaxID=3042025 RepID=A0ABT6JRB4_9GAMM|nr:lipopolysaccharide biosynthesis protein [Luteimonas kalidii]MDH5833037.1 lipopolysaccharide biosynthesis protein [Luteimonas kalidii]